MNDKSLLRRICVFCNTSEYRTSKEHLFGKWMREYFPESLNGTVVMGGPEVGERHIDIAPFTQTVSGPCEKCNNGWMSNLEAGVKSQLGPMMCNARRTKLQLYQQTLIARWSVKTAMVMQLLYPELSRIPIERYHQFYMGVDFDAHYDVWLGYRKDMPYIAGRKQMYTCYSGAFNPFGSLTSVDVVRALISDNAPFIVTFAIGHVIFQVVGHQREISIERLAPHVDLFQRIWPLARRISWPPRRPIDDVGSVEVAHGLHLSCTLHKK